MVQEPTQGGAGCSALGSLGTEVPPAPPSPTSFPPALESPLGNEVLPALPESHPSFSGSPEKHLDKSLCAAPGI